MVRIHPLMAIALTAMAMCAWIPDLVNQADIVPYIATMLLTVGVGLMLMLMLYRIGITRFYAAFPYVVYVLLIALFPSLHGDWQSQVALLGVAWMVLLLYRSQQEPTVQRTAFAGTLLLLISSLFMPAVVWLIPVFWLSLMYIHTLTFRGMLAALLAVAVFALYLTIAQYLVGPIADTTLLQFGWIMSAEVCSTGEFVGLIVLVVLMTSVALYSLSRLGKEGSDVRFSVIVFASILLVGALMSFFPADSHNNIPLVLFATSPVLSNLLHQRNHLT